VVLGDLVGGFGDRDLRFLGPELQIHLHRFLKGKNGLTAQARISDAPKRIFILALAGIVLMLAALDREVARLSWNTIPRWTMGRVRQSRGAQTIALGNSLMGVGFNEASFDAGLSAGMQQGSINLAMGGSSGVEQLLMLRYALQQGLRPRTVVFGFFDFTLTHPLEYSTRDLIGNRAMLYYMEPEYARRYYHLSPHDRAEFEIMRHFELFEDRGAVWERVELFRRALAQQGMPPEKSDSMGRSVDFAMLEYPSAPEFIAECGRASRNPLIPAIREIALQAEAAGANIYFVEMPMPPDHVHLFYDQPQWSAGYRAHLREMLGGIGAKYVDASHWMPDENSFEDPLHLTYAGAQEFSRHLGEYLRGLESGETNH